MWNLCGWEKQSFCAILKLVWHVYIPDCAVLILGSKGRGAKRPESRTEVCQAERGAQQRGGGLDKGVSAAKVRSSWGLQFAVPGILRSLAHGFGSTSYVAAMRRKVEVEAEHEGPCAPRERICTWPCGDSVKASQCLCIRTDPLEMPPE